MPTIYLQNQFFEDLADQTRKVNKQTRKALELLAQDPHHPSLATHKVTSGPKDREIFEAKVNSRHRILWEYHRDGIAVWRVGPHKILDQAANLAQLPIDGHAYQQNLPLGDEQKTEPAGYFAELNDSLLRLLGVPLAQLDTVRRVNDAERIWDLPLSSSTQSILYQLVMEYSDGADAVVFDTDKLIYATESGPLEDYCEGHLKKLFFNLTDEQRDLVTYRPNGPLLIRGVAGSGKTTIGLQRAKWIIDYLLELPGAALDTQRVLFMTYTDTHRKALVELFAAYYGGVPEFVEVATLQTKMLATVFPNMPAAERLAQLADELAAAQRALTQMRAAHPQVAFYQRKDATFFMDEIRDVIEALGIRDEARYIAVKRVGRGTGLNRTTERPWVWLHYQAFQRVLAKSGQTITASNLAWHALHTETLRQYDAVIIDEAQDLTPVSIRFAAGLVKHEQGRGFTLLADIAQSIYYRGVPWKEGGINITGRRSRALPKNFRNTRPILNAAAAILDPSEILKAKEEYIEPIGSDRPGPKPCLIKYDNREQQMALLLEAILRLSETLRYRPGDMAVLAPDETHLSAVASTLGKADVPFAHYDRDDFSVFDNRVKLVTMTAAKGLEFPVVFLIDLAEGVLPHAARSASPDDLEQERRVLYVSMTRACDRLYLFQPTQARSQFLRDLPDELVNDRCL